MRRLARALIAAAALLCASPALADGPAQPEPDVAAAPVRAEPVTPPPAAEPTASVGRSGSVTLLGGAMTLTVPEGYLFYPAPDAQAFLTRTNAPPPRGEVLGLLAPASTRIDQPGAWATVLSYDALGYVAADTATGLTASTLEADTRTARAGENRRFEGFAAQPAFSSEDLSLQWAERVASPGAGGGDLRHEQKLLGRRGVVTLTSIGSADQLTDIQTAAPIMADMIAFAPGYRYAEHDASADPLSNYDLPGLVTGVARPEPVAEVASTPTTQTSGAGLQGLYPWIAGGVVAAAAAGFLLFRRRRRAGDDNLTPDA